MDLALADSVATRLAREKINLDPCNCEASRSPAATPRNVCSYRPYRSVPPASIARAAGRPQPVPQALACK